MLAEPKSVNRQSSLKSRDHERHFYARHSDSDTSQTWGASRIGYPFHALNDRVGILHVQVRQIVHVSGSVLSGADALLVFGGQGAEQPDLLTLLPLPAADEVCPRSPLKQTAQGLILVVWPESAGFKQVIRVTEVLPCVFLGYSRSAVGCTGICLLSLLSPEHAWTAAQDTISCEVPVGVAMPVQHISRLTTPSRIKTQTWVR